MKVLSNHLVCSSWLSMLLIIFMVPIAAAQRGLPIPKPAEFGPDWQGGTGVVIKDLAEPPAFFAQSMAAVIEEYRSMGVQSMADLTYRKKTNMTYQVELKIFRFQSIPSAVEWRKKKYQYEGWQQDYERRSDGAMYVLDSKQDNQRIALYQNYWITASWPEDDDTHIQFLDRVVKMIQEGFDAGQVSSQ